MAHSLLDDRYIVPIKTPPTCGRSGTHRGMDNLGRSIGVAHLYREWPESIACPCLSVWKPDTRKKKSVDLTNQAHACRRIIILKVSQPSACTIRQLTPPTQMWVGPTSESYQPFDVYMRMGHITSCKVTVRFLMWPAAAAAAGSRVNEINQPMVLGSIPDFNAQLPKVLFLVSIPPPTHSPTCILQRWFHRIFE